MKNETVVKITHLEGYAGLRLKNKRELEIKKGINLLVGRNGSGKSALTDLVEFIFTNNFPKKNEENRRIDHFIETGFIRPVYKKTIEQYEKVKGENPNTPEHKLTPFPFPDYPWEAKICSFEVSSDEGELKLAIKDKDNVSLIKQFTQTLENEVFLDDSAPLTIIRNFDDSKKTKNLNIVRVIARPTIEEGTTSFEFEKLIMKKVPSIKPTDHQKLSDSSIYNPLINDISSSFSSNYRDFIKQEITRINDKLEQFEENLSEKLKNYWEQVIKKIRVQTIDKQDQLKFTFILEDGENQITFNTLSDGEKNLFNLILNLNVARETKPDLIIIDEPEVYMHDDMVRKLVLEISALANDLPETCIMLSTHNTALIEEVAGLDKSKVNLIIFEDKQVYNSEQDIDFINALHDNGVRFSPLMISKKPNLFIENTGKKGAKYRDFYLKFFHPRNKPNIVHIGSSGQVKEYKKVLETIQNVVNVDKAHNNKGIIDGDVWLTTESELTNYLLGIGKIEEIISQLKEQKEFYIPHSEKSNIYYFNCWEIENLYLLDELLIYWKSSSERLDKEKYMDFLKSKKEKLCESWSKTFYRSFLKPIYFGNKLEDFEPELKKAEAKLSKITSQSSEIEQRLSDFFDALLEKDLFEWMPGKEVIALLEGNKYQFDYNSVVFNNLKVTQKIRKIVAP